MTTRPQAAGITPASSRGGAPLQMGSGKAPETSRRMGMVVRQHPRYPASFSGTLVYQNRLHQITKSLDLSYKGCRLESSLRASAGMKVDLLLYVPENETPILIQHATVRWTGSHGIGIEFDSLAPPHQERLEGTLRLLASTVGHS